MPDSSSILDNWGASQKLDCVCDPGRVSFSQDKYVYVIKGIPTQLSSMDDESGMNL